MATPVRRLQSSLDLAAAATLPDSQFERSGSLLATCQSFEDLSTEATVVASLTAGDVSAAALNKCHEAACLDRGMDAMSAQNLAVAPESAVAANARSGFHLSQDHLFSFCWLNL